MYIGPKSRTERPRKTKIGTDTTFKVKRSRSPGCFAHRRVGTSGGCSGGRGNVLAVGNCCYVAVCSAAQGASAPTGEEGRGISWRPPAYSLLAVIWLLLLGPMCDRCPSCLPTNSVRVLKDVLLHCGLAVVGLLLLRQMCYDVCSRLKRDVLSQLPPKCRTCVVLDPGFVAIDRAMASSHTLVSRMKVVH